MEVKRALLQLVSQTAVLLRWESEKPKVGNRNPALFPRVLGLIGILKAALDRSSRKCSEGEIPRLSKILEMVITILLQFKLVMMTVEKAGTALRLLVLETKIRGM